MNISAAPIFSSSRDAQEATAHRSFHPPAWAVDVRPISSDGAYCSVPGGGLFGLQARFFLSPPTYRDVRAMVIKTEQHPRSRGEHTEANMIVKEPTLLILVDPACFFSWEPHVAPFVVAALLLFSPLGLASLTCFSSSFSSASGVTSNDSVAGDARIIATDTATEVFAGEGLLNVMMEGSSSSESEGREAEPL